MLWADSHVSKFGMGLELDLGAMWTVGAVLSVGSANCRV